MTASNTDLQVEHDRLGRASERRWFRYPLGLGGLLGTLVLLFVIVGPFLIPHDPNALDLTNLFAGPSWSHWLGTDSLGRDTLARLAHGGRATLLISAGAITLSSMIAIPLGLATGFVRGGFDLVATRIVDLFFAIPSLLLAIGVVGILGASAWTTILALGLAYWPFYTRLLRSAVVSASSRAYVDGARALGATKWRLVRKDVIPAVFPFLLLQTTVLFGFGILDEAGLGFLGLGVQPPNPSWGSMLNEGRQVILVHPEFGIIAGIPILITVFAINLIGDRVRILLGIDEA